MHVIAGDDESGKVLVNGSAVSGAGTWQNLLARGAHVYQRLFHAYGDRMQWAPYAAAAAAQLVKRERVDVILSTSPPLSTHAVAMQLKRQFNLFWIADFRDPLAGNPFAPERQPFRSAVERSIMSGADMVLSTTDVLAESWAKRYPKHRQKFHTIWNGFNPEEVIHAVSPPDTGPVVLSHIGEIYGARHPSIVLGSIARLLASGRVRPEDVSIRLIGPVAENSVMWRNPDFIHLRERGIVDCPDTRVTRVESFKQMAAADQLLLLDVNQGPMGVQLPAKLFDYIRVERTVMAQTIQGSPADRVLAASGVRHTCLYSSDSEEQIDRKVLEALRFPRVATPPNDWFWSQFDGRRQAQELARLIESHTASR